MLRKKDPGLLKHMADKLSSHVNELAVEHTNRLVKKEIMAYAANENCLMKKSSAEDLHKFNLLVSSFIRHKAVSDIHILKKQSLYLESILYISTKYNTMVMYIMQFDFGIFCLIQNFW